MSSAVAQQCDPRCAAFLRYVAKHYGCCAPHMAAQRLYYSGSEEAWATAVDPWEVCSPRFSVKLTNCSCGHDTSLFSRLFSDDV